MDPLYLSFSGGNITKALQVAHHCFDKYFSISFILYYLHRAGGWDVVWEILKLKRRVKCVTKCFALYFSIS